MCPLWARNKEVPIVGFEDLKSCHGRMSWVDVMDGCHGSWVMDQG